MRRALFLAYWRSERLRARKLLPRVLALTLLLALCAGLAGFLLLRRSASEEGQLLNIGLVTEEDNNWIRAGLTAFQTVDDSRFLLSLTRFDTEREAARALQNGKLDSYIVIPAGFIEGAISGEHIPARYVSGGSANSLTAHLMRDFLATASDLALESENAIYGAQLYVLERLPERDPYDAGAKLVRRFLWTVMDRAALSEVQLNGVGGLSFAGYYVAGLGIAFLLLAGLNAAPLASRRSVELGQMLKARGLGAGTQILAEYLPFAGLDAAAWLCVSVLAAATSGLTGVAVPELSTLTGGETALLWLKTLPVVLLLAAMQLFLYEISPGTVGGLLLQVLNALGQGYLAGCFYPASFFPQTLRRIGELLPAGVGMQAMNALLRQTGTARALLLTAACALLFLALTAVVRGRRLGAWKVRRRG